LNSDPLVDPRPSEPAALEPVVDELDEPPARVEAPRLPPIRVVALLNADERPVTPPPAVEVTWPVLLTLLVELGGREFDWTV
jgi:hypothetical protein